MKRSCLLFISGVIASAGISASAFAANPDSTQFSVEVKPYLNVTLSNSDVHLPITPSSTGAFGSAALTASASTNSALGYALNLSFLDSNNNLNTNLVSNTVNVNDGTYPTIPTFTTNDELTSDAFSASTSEDHLNHWAISINDTNHYKKALTESTIATSNAPIADDTTTINLATKLDLRTVPGSYSVIMKFEVVANPEPPENNPINNAMGGAGKRAVSVDGVSYYTMQDFSESICDSITTPTAADYSDTPEARLVDSRDGKLYWVAKLKDGKCWMTQNLDLDLVHVENDEDALYTHENTDIGWGTDTTTDRWNPEKSTTTTIGTDFGDGSNNSNYFHPKSYDIGNAYWADGEAFASSTPYAVNGQHGHLGNYYNWSAAVASNDTSSYEYSTLSNTANNPQNSICPAGWRLPIMTNDASDPNNDFKYLLDQYDAIITTGDGQKDIRVVARPLYFLRAGRPNDGGMSSEGYLGNYWTSTVGSKWLSQYLVFRTNNVDASYYEYRYLGLSVRCVVR